MEKLLPDDFHQHALAAFAVELTVKDLFPRTEVEFAIRDRNNDFATMTWRFKWASALSSPVRL